MDQVIHSLMKKTTHFSCLLHLSFIASLISFSLIDCERNADTVIFIFTSVCLPLTGRVFTWTAWSYVPIITTRWGHRSACVCQAEAAFPGGMEDNTADWKSIWISLNKHVPPHSFLLFSECNLSQTYSPPNSSFHKPPYLSVWMSCRNQSQSFCKCFTTALSGMRAPGKVCKRFRYSDIWIYGSFLWEMRLQSVYMFTT